MEKIIEVKKLVRDYVMSGNAGNRIHVLKNLEFDIAEREFVAVMGRSGCGKTTLLKTLGLIDRPTDGKIFFKGRDTQELWLDERADIRRREIGFIFQDFYLLDSLSVKENIMLPMILDKADVSTSVAEAEKLAEQFEIEALLEKKPYELSGGEKQRAAICRALINNPELILADEPTGNLDSRSGGIVINAMEKINQQLGKTIIMVTHDPKVASHCQKVIFLKDGRIIEVLNREDDKKEQFFRVIIEEMEKL